MFSVTIREKSGQVYTFHFDKPEIMIGRVKGNDVILPKQNISKRHALVRVQGGRFIVEDLGSTNGTYVNGHRIATPVEIGSEDKVYLGDFVMQYYDLGQSTRDADQDLEIEAALGEAGADFAETPALDAVVDSFSAEPASDSADIDFEGAGEFDGFDSDYELPSFDAEVADAPGKAVDEPTMAELDGPAQDAIAEIAARRAAAEAGEPDAVVASLDPTAIDPDDDRMTGPIDGLSAALDAAAAPDLDMGLDLHLDLDLPAPEAEPTAAGLEEIPMSTVATFETPGSHYEALEQLYVQAIDTLGPSIRGDAAQLSDTEWATMEAKVIAFVDERAASDALGEAPDVDRLKRDLIYEISGLGPLETLLDDASIESIEVNAFDAIWLLRQGERASSALQFSSQAALTAAAERLVRASGVALDDASTWVDGTLADGTTIRVAWPPMCPSGPVLLIRKPRSDSPSLQELVNRDVVTEAAAEQLLSLLLAGRSIGLVGPSGAGRRTVLNALAQHIPDNERIVVTEQGVRLHLEQPQVIRLDATAGVDTVLRIAHRLRPDRVLLGTCGANEMMALLHCTSDGFAPWMGLLVGQSADAAVERVVSAHAIQYPGASRATACARVATALDVLGVFSAAEGGPVLTTVVEVVREGDELRTLPLEG